MEGPWKGLNLDIGWTFLPPAHYDLPIGGTFIATPSFASDNVTLIYMWGSIHGIGCCLRYLCLSDLTVWLFHSAASLFLSVWTPPSCDFLTYHRFKAGIQGCQYTESVRLIVVPDHGTLTPPQSSATQTMYSIHTNSKRNTGAFLMHQLTRYMPTKRGNASVCF